MHVTALHVYPLKSGRGIALNETEIVAEGIPGDRRMMLVDPDGTFITQRDTPALARLDVQPQPGGVTIALDGGGEALDVTLPPAERRMDVVVWKSQVSAAVADDAINATLSRWMDRDVRLVFFDGNASRTASAEWAGEGTPVTFADGYQVLITTTASLAALNADMEAHDEGAVGMERFRPNIVLETDQAWAEDGWASLDIGGVIFDLVKPCARCIMTTQDQQTGSREVASPMAAMGRVRMSADRRVPGPLFGCNAVPRSSGKLHVGSPARVLKERETGWDIKQR